MKYATMKSAKESIERYKDLTGYFDGSLKISDMVFMLRDMHFGVAETNVIIAALILAGGKFTVE